jgi:HAD superfamily hydrolase (TIGR01509 family)
MERFIAEFGLPEAPEGLLEEKNAEYLALARENTVVFPEMRVLIEGLSSRGIPMAVASGSSPVVISEILRITRLQPYFIATVSSEDVPNGKPEPDVFLEAARRIGASPKETLVVEDAVYGVMAAKRAGMRCAVVPTFPGPPLDPALLEADYVVSGGMPDFRAADLLHWVDDPVWATDSGRRARG